MRDKIVILDIETLDFFQDPFIKDLPSREAKLAAIRPGLIGVGIANGLELTVYPVTTLNWDPAELWEDLCSAARVVTFNGNQFDLPLLYQWAVARRSLRDPIRQSWPKSFDLLHEINQATGNWYSLDELAKKNLDQGKTGNGEDAVALLRTWFEGGDTDALNACIKYNTDDLHLTNGLYYTTMMRDPITCPKKDKKGYERELNVFFNADGWISVEYGRH